MCLRFSKQNGLQPIRFEMISQRQAYVKFILFYYN